MANLANCQPVNTNNAGGTFVSVYYSDPSNQRFRDCFTNAVPKAVHIDVWNNYHCAFGEGHCGTAATREMPATPWWEQPAIQNKWKDEQ